MKPLIRKLLLLFLAILLKTITKPTFIGRENVPLVGQPYLYIANHFGWFEFLYIMLLVPEPPVVFGATENLRFAFIRWLTRYFDYIPVWRGQVDRNALKLGLKALAAGKSLIILPEGGISPELQEMIQRGEQVRIVGNHHSRLSAQLIKGRPGASFLAVESGARIVPFACLGTELVIGNLRRWRRTAVTVYVGQPFGPLTVPAFAKGASRRAWLDYLADEMMWHIAELMPAQNRGIYQQPPQPPTVPATVEKE